LTNTAAIQTAELSTEWARWLIAIAGREARQVDISERTGIDQSTVSRWLAHGHLPGAVTAVTVARAYRVDPVEALIAAAYLTREDVELPSVDARQIPTRILLDEIARRTDTRP
jgi:hypothetical protein